MAVRFNGVDFDGGIVDRLEGIIGAMHHRYPGGKGRYYGGETHAYSVHCSISFSELLVKLGEKYGSH
ncbi:hypothetical protein ACS0TY_016468 [Phlomoides rotata]